MYTKIWEVNSSAFIYLLFHEDFSSPLERVIKDYISLLLPKMLS